MADWRPSVAVANGSRGGYSDAEDAKPVPEAPALAPPVALPAGPTTALEDLPIFAHKEIILEHVRKHRVTHIQGETGCGKSTQVPKYIMQDAEARHRAGETRRETKIIVTQPRRMAAITLAKRCAAELGEEIGKTIGYKISGDSVSGKLSFATTGFLLQVLVNQPEEFGTYTHVILDEIHERSVDADLLTMLVKLLMQCYPDIKLVVMSATLQAHLFAHYFAVIEKSVLGAVSNVPTPEVKPLFVGARVFPVEQIFLDEIEDQFSIDNSQARKALDQALMRFQGISEKGNKGKGKGKKGGDRGIDGAASGFMRAEPKITEGFDYLCKDLIQQMAKEKCTLIVFLPGIADITSFYETLSPLDSTRVERFEQRSKWDADDVNAPPNKKSGNVTLRIFPMHSLIPREDQEEVFNQPKAGTCHVVLASNIAESSLTFPSVCAVIDMSLRRSIEYDARRLMSCLVTTWCSQSSCKQRSGRAGRTMPGRAVRMVPRKFFEDEMVDFDPPEMLSAPLTRLYLQAKQLCIKLANLHNAGIVPSGIGMNLTTPTMLLGEVVQPPATDLVEAAIRELADIGALDRPNEEALITPLGHICMALPCDLRLCRLLHFGLILGCPCDAIAMVAGLTAADPFSAPSIMVLKDEREYCKKLERSFEARLWCDRGRHSEPLMLRELFMEWINAGSPKGPRSMGAFARDWNVIPKKMEAVSTEAVDIASRLCKLVKPASPSHESIQRLLAAMRFHVDRREELVSSGFPSNSDYKRLFCDDVNMMRALLAVSFSDQLIVHLQPRWEVGGGKKRKEQQMAAIMKSQGLDNSGTVVLMIPPVELKDKRADWQTEENHQRLCEALCGEQAQQIYWDEKEKLLFFDFVGRTKRNKREGRAPPCGWKDTDPLPILSDASASVHRCHQFGAGRWKFSMENPIYHGEGSADACGMEMLEITRPVQPFLLNWDVVQHMGQVPLAEYQQEGKKPEKVKAMPDWRNPLGFACDIRDIKPAREHLGVCASIQGLESGASAFIAGASVLGMNHLPLILSAIDPAKFKLQWGFDAKTQQIVSVKLMQFEINLPPDTITEDVLWKVNVLRQKIQESLKPEEDDRPKKGKGKGSKGSGHNYIFVADIKADMEDLLSDIWDEPYPVRKSNKVNWGYGALEPDSDLLASLDALAEEYIPVDEPPKLTKAEMKKRAKEHAAVRQAEAKARPKSDPKKTEGSKQLPDLEVGDVCTLFVKFGDFKGNHPVTIVSQEENGWKVKHQKDGFEEVVKDRNIRMGKQSLMKK